MLASTWASALAWGGAAQAGPSLYANSFQVNVSQADCLRDSLNTLIGVGMRQQDITAMTYRDDNGRDIQNGWSGDHPSENITAMFECDARNGMGAIAVSGSNNDATYKVYQQLWDLWMK